MAISMNGFASAVEKGWGKTGAWRAKAGRMGVVGGRRMMGNSVRRMATFSKMAANEGYWKAYQKALQGPMLDGAVKGAMIGAGLNTAQYLYNNSDRPDLRGAAGAAFRGAVGGGAVGGIAGGIGHFAGGNPLTGRFSTRAARDLRAVNRAESAVKASRKWRAPKVPRGKFSASERSAAMSEIKGWLGKEPVQHGIPGPMQEMGRPSFLGGSHTPIQRPVVPGMRGPQELGRPAFLGGSHTPSTRPVMPGMQAPQQHGRPSFLGGGHIPTTRAQQANGRLAALIHAQRPGPPVPPTPSLASLIQQQGLGYS